LYIFFKASKTILFTLDNAMIWIKECPNILTV
jgi:hypothetical protein